MTLFSTIDLVELLLIKETLEKKLNDVNIEIRERMERKSEKSEEPVF